MTALAIDLGGTKLSFAIFTPEGEILHKQTIPLQKRSGREAGHLITEEIQKILALHPSVNSIGLAVPGIYRQKTGTVWAPNIPGWDDYPLLQEINAATDLPVTIDSDRAAYILGERWMGEAKGCLHAIYLSVGTGIGAGILINGEVLRGAHDIAGAIGWLALKPPFEDKYISCGCFEYHASGEGIPKLAQEVLAANDDYNGLLRQKSFDDLKAADIFSASDQNDPLAHQVIQTCVQFWGMTVANLVSLFNPEKIIFGGGVFGPALKYLDAIENEAAKWAQPVSMKMVQLLPSALGSDAGLYGAGWLAWNIKEKFNHV